MLSTHHHRNNDFIHFYLFVIFTFITVFKNGWCIPNVYTQYCRSLHSTPKYPKIFQIRLYKYLINWHLHSPNFNVWDLQQCCLKKIPTMYYTNPYYVRTYCTNIYTAYFIFIIRAYVVNNICKRVIRHSSDLNFKRRGYNYPLLTIGKNLLIIMMTFFCIRSTQHCPDNGMDRIGYGWHRTIHNRKCQR